MYWPKKIVDLFPTVINSFREKELAYLSLTSKPERPIQDRYALLLNKKIDDKVFIKEYKRRDLVVFHDNGRLASKPNKEVDHVIEFKAGSASSFSKKIQGEEYYSKANEFIGRVVKDIANRKREGSSYADTLNLGIKDLTGVFIGVEVLDEIPEKFTELFQYSSRHNRHLSHEEKPDLEKRMIERFTEYTGEHSVKAFNTVLHRVEEVGSFENIRVKIHLIAVQGNSNFPFQELAD
ncbi:hypothetical protein [Fodinibius saliphilus]|uniref:hypothetical protein n=1 Tax=Fodinibius saliphilus TaxID=1920650 RepID=UPI0011099474|nr:hypothetical protein [Fodinibius saliphilus]